MSPFPLKNDYPLYCAGQAISTTQKIPVYDKYTGEKACTVSMANADIIEQAISAADAATQAVAATASWQRKATLDHCCKRFEERFEELAQALCIEAGKPINDARGEVTRLIDTFQIAAEECVRQRGHSMPLDRSPRTTGYTCYYKQVPIGAVALITPFNFPLNLVAHKVAPAIAAGCPFVLKPASATPIGALVIGEILQECEHLPASSWSILPCKGSAADPLVTDDRLKALSFTGSPAVGWDLKARSGKKKVVMELGGNAACIVDADADIDDAVNRIIIGAFYQSGQSCISVQRIIAHENIYEELRDKLITASKKLSAGDPKRESTFVGPVISETEAQRIETWIQDAVHAGAKLLCGGTRTKRVVKATLLEQVPKNCAVVCSEIFGPVAVLSSFSHFDDALAEVNDSIYGLQAGVFTNNINKAHKAWETLHVGGVVIGDIPSWRADEMPYGGVKESGCGREGIVFAIEDFSEIRSMVIRTRPIE